MDPNDFEGSYRPTHIAGIALTNWGSGVIQDCLVSGKFYIKGVSAYIGGIADTSYRGALAGMFLAFGYEDRGGTGYPVNGSGLQNRRYGSCSCPGQGTCVHSNENAAGENPV